MARPLPVGYFSGGSAGTAAVATRGGTVGEDLGGAGEPGPGSVIGGYRVESRIGTDAMGTLFRAQDERHGRLVALKVLAPQWTADTEFRLRFIAESRALATIDNPHVIPVYEAGEDDGVLFAATSLLSGPDAGDILRYDGVLPPARALALLSPAASALDAVHRVGLVHRDVRPENIVIDKAPGRPEQVYLTGFGQGGRAAAGTGGSPDPAPYSSPEQARGDIIGGRADQYSLACVAFQLLTGHLPDDNGPGLPATARPVLARAMAATPGERYPTCQDFTDALRAALGLADATGDRNRAAPKARRRPVTGLTSSSTAPEVTAQGSRKLLFSIITTVAIVVVAAIAIPLALSGSPAPHKAATAKPPAARRPASGLSRIATLIDPNGLQAPDAVAFAPSGRTLIVANPSGYVESWSTSTHQLGSTAQPPLSTGVMDPGAFSADGRALATLGLGNRDIYLWSIAAGRTTATIGVSDGTNSNADVNAIVFSPDGRTVAIADQKGSAYLYDAATGTITATIKAPAGSIGTDGVAFSPDGRTIATSDGNGDIYLWNAATRARTATIGDSGPGSLDALYSATFSPDGRTIAVTDDSGTTYIWNVATHQQVTTLAGSPATTGATPEIAYSPNGRVLATVNGTAQLWNATTYRSIATIPGTVTWAAFSPDGRTLATANDSGEITLWRIPSS